MMKPLRLLHRLKALPQTDFALSESVVRYKERLPREPLFYARCKKDYRFGPLYTMGRHTLPAWAVQVGWVASSSLVSG